MTQQLDGEFAFTIFDTIRNTVTREIEFNMFLGRDRFGIRPLFYTINNNVVAAASEMKALMGIGEKVEMFPPRMWMHFKGNRNGNLTMVTKEYYTAGIPMQI